MNTRSLNKIASVAVLLSYLITPSLAFAQCGPGGCSNSGNTNNSGFGGMNPLLLMMMMQGGRGGLGSGSGAGGVGQVGQFLALAGLLSGNMGLAMAGLLTSMLGSLSGAGGQGATPQTGQVDEQYVGPGQGGPSGIGGNANNPYYTTPTPNPSTSPAPSCSQSIFIVKDTTATPATTKPYPDKVSISQSDCALVINTDSTSHSLGGNSVDAQNSKIFRFGTKKTYNMCIDSSTTACTAVTVQ